VKLLGYEYTNNVANSSHPSTASKDEKNDRQLVLLKPKPIDSEPVVSIIKTLLFTLFYYHCILREASSNE
jgi:hypothetical protein